MLFLIYDFETSGLDPKIHSIIEVGLCLWEITTKRIVRVVDFFVYEPDMIWDPGAIAKHGITPEICEKYGMASDKAFRQFMSYANSADVYVAYNGKNFDFPMWEAWAAKNNSAIPERLRFDPMVDIQWPKEWKSRELFYVAAKYGILNHFAHTGVGDVLTTTEILARQKDLGAILEYAKMPEIWIEGVCSIDDRERVKTNGYHWWPWPQDQTQNKKWIKSIKEGLLDQEKAVGKEIGFSVRRLS